jgi:hypothetical protein
MSGDQTDWSLLGVLVTPNCNSALAPIGPRVGSHDASLMRRRTMCDADLCGSRVARPYLLNVRPSAHEGLRGWWQSDTPHMLLYFIDICIHILYYMHLCWPPRAKSGLQRQQPSWMVLAGWCCSQLQRQKQAVWYTKLCHRFKQNRNIKNTASAYLGLQRGKFQF